MSAEKAKSYALQALVNGSHPEDRLDNIARALFEIAATLETLERKVERKN